ncbi:MAG: oligosaccharide flippase family protein [Pseudomonadota bacterium]
MLRLAFTGINLIFGILAARLVGDETFGSYVSVIAIAGLLSVVTAAGLPSLLQRELSLARGSGNFSMLTPLIQWFVAINFFFAVSAVLVALFAQEYLVYAFLFVCVSNIAAAFGAINNGFERVLLSQWIGSIVRPLGAVLALVLVYQMFGPSLSGLLVSQILGVSLALIFFSIFWIWPNFQTMKKALRSSWWSAQHAKVLKGGVLISGTQFLINSKTQIEIFLLTFLASPVDVAYYYAASRAALVVAFFSTSTFLMAEPRLTRLMSAKEDASLLKEVRSTRQIAFFGTLVAASFAALLTPYYLGLYGEGFASANTVMYLLIFSIVLRSMFGPALPILRASRQDYPALKVSVITLLLFTPLSIILIMQYGIVGAAMGSLVYSTINEFWLARAAKQTTGISTRMFS